LKPEYYSLKNHWQELFKTKGFASILLFLLTVLSVYGTTTVLQQPVDEPLPIETQLDSARTLINSQDYIVALSYLENISAINSPTLHVQHQLLLGTIYFHQGFFDKALAQFEYTLSLHGVEENLVFADLNSWIGSCHLRLVKFKKAKKYFNKVLLLRKKLLGSRHEKVSYVYNNLGLLADEYAQFDDAIRYYQQALDIVKEKYGENHYEPADYYFKIGETYTKKKNYVLANEYLQRSLAIYVQSFGVDHFYTAQVYYGLGLFYRDIGNTKRAASHLSKAANIFEKTLGKEHQKVNYLKYELATVYLEMEEYDKAESLLRIAIANYLSREDEDYYLVSHAYESLGKALIEKREYQEALTYYNKAIQTNEQQFGRFHQYTYDTYLSLAQSLTEYGDHIHATKVFETVQEIGLKIFSKDAVRHSEAYLAVSECYLKQNRFVEAQEYLTKTQNILAGVDAVSHLYNKEIAEMELMQVQLYLKNTTLSNSEQVTPLLKADSIIIKVENRLDELKKYFQSVASGQSLNSQFYDFYQLAIETSFLLYTTTEETKYLDRAFAFSEKSKTFILMRTLQEEEATHIAGIPDSLIRKADELSAAITYKEKQLFEDAQQVVPNELLGNKLSGELFNLQSEHEALLNQIETDYPTYYQLKYALESVPISTFQKEGLKEKSSLVEYFVGDTAIYVFLIDKQEAALYKLPKPKDLPHSIQQFRNSIYNYQPLQDNELLIADFTHYGHELYQQLIAPIEVHLQPNLIIVANDFLEYLPFDALVRKKGEDTKRFRTYKYLVDNHAISYAYSATWLQALEQQPQLSFDKEYLGVAPTFTGQEAVMNSGTRSSLSTLHFNVDEIKVVHSLFGGDILKGLQATRTAFKNIAKDYRVLHLATHGKSNNTAGDYSFLAFTTTNDSTTTPLFYVKDLLQLQVPAELVVLSACETGIGEIQKGEGVISVGKGFSYAGAKSILTTLWTINDQTTSKLIPLFFKQLKAGQPKDKALQLAKQQFIKENRDAHPYYWSGYMIIGDTGRMSFNRFQTSTLWIGGLLGSFLLGCMIWVFGRHRFAE